MLADEGAHVAHEALTHSPLLIILNREPRGADGRTSGTLQQPWLEHGGQLSFPQAGSAEGQQPQEHGLQQGHNVEHEVRRAILEFLVNTPEGMWPWLSRCNNSASASRDSQVRALAHTHAHTHTHIELT